MTNSATIQDITPATAQKLLAENGLQVSPEQAAGILEFLSKLAAIALPILLQNQKPLINEEDSLSLHTGEHRRAS